MATAFSIDLRELDVELAKTKATVDAWAKHKTDSFINARDAHFQTMQDQSAKLNELQAAHVALTASVQQVKQRVQVEENESEAAQQAAKEAQLSHEALRQRVEAMREELRLKDEACLELEEACLLNESIKTKKLNALRKALALYSTRLGLDFTSKDGVLELVFTRVDPSQPTRPFAVSVKVQEDKSYIVTKCSPPLQCLPGLLSTLNQTGDFSGFTKEVRTAFQKGL